MAVRASAISSKTDVDAAINGVVPQTPVLQAAVAVDKTPTDHNDEMQGPGLPLGQAPWAEEAGTAAFEMLRGAMRMNESNSRGFTQLLCYGIEMVQVLGLYFSASRLLPWHRTPLTSVAVMVADALMLGAAETGGIGPGSRFMLMIVAVVTMVLLGVWLLVYINNQVKEAAYIHGAKVSKMAVRATHLAHFLAPGVLFIPICSLLLIGFRCAPGSTWGDTGLQCWEPVHIVVTIVLVFALLAFVTLVEVLVVVLPDRRPSSDNPFAMPTGRVHAATLLIRAVGCIVLSMDELLSPLALVLMMTATAVAEFLGTVLFLPYFSMRVNQVRAGVLGLAVWSCLCAAFWLGMADADGYMASFILVSTGVFVYFASSALARARFRSFESILDMPTPFHVELKVRWLMSSSNTLAFGASPGQAALAAAKLAAASGGSSVAAMAGSDHQTARARAAAAQARKQAVALNEAETVLSSALTAMPYRTTHLLVAHFLMAYRQNRHLEKTHLNVLDVKGAYLDEQFWAFHRSACLIEADEANSAGTMNISTRVKFEQFRRRVLEHELRARAKQVMFWSQLLEKRPSVVLLERISADISESTQQADEAYAALLRMNPRSLSTLRSFAQFLMDVKNMPDVAQQMLQQADEIEDELSREHLDKTTPFELMSHTTNLDVSSESVAVVMVSDKPTNLGEIISTNQAAVRTFGYTRKELVGRPLSSLLPEPFGTIHDSFLKSYLATGREVMMNTSREVLALHRAGHIFPALLAVRSMEGGLGGLLQEVPSSEGIIIFLTKSLVITGACQRSFSLLGANRDAMTSKSLRVGDFFPRVDVLLCESARRAAAKLRLETEGMNAATMAPLDGRDEGDSAVGAPRVAPFPSDGESDASVASDMSGRGLSRQPSKADTLASEASSLHSGDVFAADGTTQVLVQRVGKTFHSGFVIERKGSRLAAVTAGVQITYVSADKMPGATLGDRVAVLRWKPVRGKPMRNVMSEIASRIEDTRRASQAAAANRVSGKGSSARSTDRPSFVRTTGLPSAVAEVDEPEPGPAMPSSPAARSQVGAGLGQSSAFASIGQVGPSTSTAVHGAAPAPAPAPSASSTRDAAFPTASRAAVSAVASAEHGAAGEPSATSAEARRASTRFVGSGSNEMVMVRLRRASSDEPTGLAMVDGDDSLAGSLRSAPFPADLLAKDGEEEEEADDGEDEAGDDVDSLAPAGNDLESVDSAAADQGEDSDGEGHGALDLTAQPSMQLRHPGAAAAAAQGPAAGEEDSELHERIFSKRERRGSALMKPPQLAGPLDLRRRPSDGAMDQQGQWGERAATGSHHGSSTGSQGSRSSVGKSLRRIIEKSADAFEPSLRLLNTTLICVVVLVSLLNVASMLTARQLLEGLKAQLGTVRSSGQRQLLGVQTITKMQSAVHQAVSEASLNAASSPVTREQLLALGLDFNSTVKAMSAYLEEFRLLNRQLYLEQAVGDNEALQRYYHDPVLPTTRFHDRYNSTTHMMGLMDLASEFNFRAHAMAMQPEAAWRQGSRGDVAFVLENGAAGMAYALNESTQIAQSTAESAFHAATLAIAILLIIAVAITFITLAAVVSPITLAVERTKDGIWRMFLDVPLVVVRRLRGIVQTHLDAKVAENDDEDDDLGGMDVMVAEGEGNNDTEREPTDPSTTTADALLHLDWQRLARNSKKKKKRAFSKSWMSFVRMVVILYLPLVAAMAYFIGSYFWVSGFVDSSIRSGRSVFYSMQRQTKMFQTNFAVVTALEQENSTRALELCDAATSIANDLRYLEDVILYGSAELNLVPAHDSEAQSRLFLEDICPTLFGGSDRARCEAFSSGVLRQGLHAGLLQFTELATSIVRQRAEEIRSGTVVTTLERLESPMRLELREFAFIYMSVGLERASWLTFNEVVSSVDAFLGANLAFTIVAIMVQVFGYLFMHRTVMINENASMKRTRERVLLFPDVVLRSLPVFRDLVNSMSGLKYSGDAGQPDAGSDHSRSPQLRPDSGR